MKDQNYLEYHCGSGIYLRQSKPEGMKVDEVVLGHQHAFDHVTFVTRGAIEVSLLKVTRLNAEGNPLDAEIEWSKSIRADDEVNWVNVLKGRFHTLRSLEAGSRYQCTYAARLPQSITIHEPGQQQTLPLVKRDENGVLWYREDPKIVETSEWTEAYR